MVSFEQELIWLWGFWNKFPPEVEGDDLGTTFGCAGAVLLTAAALRTESAVLIHRITGLPYRFAAAVVDALDRGGLRHGERFRDLEQTVHKDPGNTTEVNASLESLLEQFWMAISFRQVETLQRERASALLGGLRQEWIDEEELAAFLLDLSPNRHQS